MIKSLLYSKYGKVALRSSKIGQDYHATRNQTRTYHHHIMCHLYCIKRNIYKKKLGRFGYHLGDVIN